MSDSKRSDAVEGFSPQSLLWHRIRARMDWQHLASAAGDRAWRIERYEAGKSTPTAARLEALASALGIPPSELTPGAERD